MFDRVLITPLIAIALYYFKINLKKQKKNESIHLQLKLHLNHFKSMFYFYTPEKVREYRIGTLPENGFAIISEQEFQFSQKFG